MVNDQPEMNRLRWRCRRGLLELDLLLGRFLDEQYKTLTLAEQGNFTRLLDTPDTTLMAYLNGSEQCSDLDLEYIITKIQ